MKGQLITLKGGQEAKVEAEVIVSQVANHNTTIRLLQLLPQNTFIVTRNDFMVRDENFEGNFAYGEEVVKLFMKTVMENTFK
jgi:hypothetical protein